eukprot:TRINITY_DN14376_c0_g1_i2.p1 TRINITY_DN14376_c0_g1~~TRINITY_DN14376_c0_g1_i2.p1  ORF type:complete len:552 (-),score=39.38 TRINITY_DN14376_c0_g1_i2:82-1557(-)
MPTVDQAELFLDVACTGSRFTPPSTNGRSLGAGGNGSASSPKGLLAEVLIACICLPCAFFFALTPLFFQNIIFELFHVYFYGLHVFFGALFTETICREGLGTAVSGAGLLAIWSTGVAAAFSPCFFPESRWGFTSVLGGILIALYGPAVARLGVNLWRGQPSSHLGFLFCILTLGAVPVALSVSVYLISKAFGWLEDKFTFWFVLFVWCLAPFLVKPTGIMFVTRCMVADRFTAIYCWMFYCEAAFGALGLALFAHSISTSVIYTASLVPILCLQLFRGTKGVVGLQSCVGVTIRARIVRVGIMLEALVCVLGRSIAYVLYLLMVGKDALIGYDSLVRPSLISGKTTRILGLNVYRQFQSRGADIVAALLGFFFLWFAFAIFVALIPQVWQSLEQVHPAAPPAGNMAERRRAWDLPEEIQCEVDDMKKRVAESKYSCWIQDGQTHGDTLDNQYKVLVSFLCQQRREIIVTILFILIFSISSLELARAFLNL